MSAGYDPASGQGCGECATEIGAVTKGQQVTFRANSGETCAGTVARVWGKPARDPYVTIRTEDGAGEGRVRTFVRAMSAVDAGPPEWEPDDGEALRIAEVYADARAEFGEYDCTDPDNPAWGDCAWSITDGTVSAAVAAGETGKS